MRSLLLPGTIVIVFFAGTTSRLQTAEKLNKNVLPGFPQVKCNLRLLELEGDDIPKGIRGAFKITKAGFDEKNAAVYWVIHLQRDDVDLNAVRTAWGLTPLQDDQTGPAVIVKDIDRVMVAETPLLLQGFHYRMKQGDGIRVILPLQQQREILPQIRFVDVIK